ncbi:triosephosphate isomerase [Tilletia horrida]|uniref:Triosephosphate isomerase n=1 Tax=Tilletia horrida TaxID=155126 RepID=A0AAN6JRQ0_9BASI|nr:triosephosphate isomerase [Tilletia horrida]KAK0550975.1 triosephosphate isomerase [Tilletia horrida]KAK0566028.1 triosephosphate isomerase [Tilletia horrida]
MTRQMFIGGNWKMNGTLSSAEKLVRTILDAKLDPEVQIIVAPPALHLLKVKDMLSSSRVEVSAQNAYHKPSGAFTGEVSVTQLKDASIPWVIIGHSERRTIFGELDGEVAEKTAAAIAEGLGVILCVGETLQEREANKTIDVVVRQLDAVAAKVSTDKWDKIVVAYEPVWAIGTGKVATSQQAQEVHAEIRKWAGKALDSSTAEKLRIIYGGSVAAKNCKELSQQPDIDGFLVGGASLKPEFVDIINARL